MAGHRFQTDTGDEIISEINVIPLVDISLVLLIILMATANYILTSAFTVDLPQANNAGAIEDDNLVTVRVSSDGPIYLENEVVTTAELKKEVGAKYKQNPDISVILASEKSTQFKDVIRVFDILSALGIKKLNIAVVNEP